MPLGILVLAGFNSRDSPTLRGGQPEARKQGSNLGAGVQARD